MYLRTVAFRCWDSAALGIDSCPVRKMAVAETEGFDYRATQDEGRCFPGMENGGQVTSPIWSELWASSIR